MSWKRKGYIFIICMHAFFMELISKYFFFRMKLDGIKERVKVSEVELLPPISNSDKVICVGMNYKDHCEEQNCPVPAEPIFFSKFASTLVGPFADVPYPKPTNVWCINLTPYI